MIRFIKTSMTIFLAVMAAMTLCAKELLLVEKGMPNARIVIPSENPGINTNYAVYELKYHIKLITGAELPVVTAKEAAKLSTNKNEKFVQPINVRETLQIMGGENYVREKEESGRAA